MSLQRYEPFQYTSPLPLSYTAPPSPSPVRDISPFERYEGNLTSVSDLCNVLGLHDSFTLYSDGQVREANRQIISQGGMAAAILARSIEPHKRAVTKMTDLQVKLASGVDEKIQDLETQLTIARKQKIMIDRDLKTFVSELDDIACSNTTVIANAMSNTAHHNAQPEIPTTAPTLTQNTLCRIPENTAHNQMVTQTVSQNFDGGHTQNSASSPFYFGNATNMGTNRLSIDTSTLQHFFISR